MKSCSFFEVLTIDIVVFACPLDKVLLLVKNHLVGNEGLKMKEVNYLPSLENEYGASSSLTPLFMLGVADILKLIAAPFISSG